MNFSLFGVDMRELFQIRNYNLSVAVWVGFLALFGSACGEGDDTGGDPFAQDAVDQVHRRPVEDDQLNGKAQKGFEVGFDVVGVDIAESMLSRAREIDPEGDYRQVPDGALPGLEPGSFDLILSTFTFDNIPTMARKAEKTCLS